MWRPLLIASCLTALSGCSKTPLLLAPSYPPNLTQVCDPLQPFDGTSADDLIGYTLILTDQYRDCSTRHAALAKAVQ